jgi:hypothetical protein
MSKATSLEILARVQEERAAGETVPRYRRMQMASAYRMRAAAKVAAEQEKPPRARAIDKTDQGDQLVMPGAERRTIPGKPYSVEADGQLLLAGVAPVTDADRAQHGMDAPLRPRRGQKLPPLDGLFRR